MADSPQLTEPQLAILRVIWARGEATVPEVWKTLYPERGLAQSTVATMMARLEKRGVLSRRTDDGRQYVYRATVSEWEVRQAMTAELTSLLFGGDAAALVSHLVETRQVRPGDLDQVRRLLDASRIEEGESDDE